MWFYFLVRMNEVLINFFLSSYFVCIFFSWEKQRALSKTSGFSSIHIYHQNIKKDDVSSIILPQETSRSYIISLHNFNK